jgi:RNase H-fold protein (predicted Holliday junction resolvase)
MKKPQTRQETSMGNSNSVKNLTQIGNLSVIIVQVNFNLEGYSRPYEQDDIEKITKMLSDGLKDIHIVIHTEQKSENKDG